MNTFGSYIFKHLLSNSAEYFLFRFFCYIIKELFLLIIFYHSVWLGFELFGLRVQVYSQLVQFTLVRKGYDNHHWHNKSPDWKWGWSVDDVLPGKYGPVNLRILKKSHLRVENGSWRQIVEFLPLTHRVEFSTVEACSWDFRISTVRDLKHHGIRSAFVWSA